MASPKVFAAALRYPDSLQALTDLGSIRYNGRAGDSVVVTFDADEDVRGAIPAAEQLVISSGADTTRQSLHELRSAVIHRMLTDGPVELHLALTRRFEKSVTIGTARLAAVAASSSAVAVHFPWSPQSSGSDAPSKTTISTSMCTATAPGTWCGIKVGITPYAPGAPFGDFQSQAGTAASAPITLTFSPAIKLITLTAQDPTWAGNTMTAYSITGRVVGSVTFPGSGVPGENVSQTRTITGAGITRVVLVPADTDYVAYSGLTFAPDDSCQPYANPTAILDSLLRDPYVQDVLKELASEAGWSKPFGAQVEHGLFVMRNAATSADTVVPYDNQIADSHGNLFTLPPGPCLSSSTLRDLTLLAQHGYTPILQMHVHPKHGYWQFPVSNCYDPDPNHNPPYATREPVSSNGMLQLPAGPSKTDVRPWKGDPNDPAFPMWPGYVVEPGRVYQWDAPVSNGFKFVQHDWALQSCVGGDR